MNRRARLTLILVGLVALLTGTISAYYLATGIANQFDYVLDRADALKSLAADAVRRSLEERPSLPVPEALANDEDLADRLRNIMAVSRSLLEITVCDAHNVVLISTDTSRRPGDPFPENYPDYGQLTGRPNFIRQLGSLRDSHTPRFYQLSQALTLRPEGQSPDLYVRVVVLPALIRIQTLPQFQKAAVVSLLSILGSILIALVFSHFAFQPLGSVAKMLDDLTRGDYDAKPPWSRPAAEDEYGVMVSKVNLLGQQLGNFERLLDQLEEAVLVFGGDRHLIVASGALEKFLGRRRAALMGLTMRDIFPSDAPVGFFLEQILETGRTVRNFPVRLSEEKAEANGAASIKLSRALLSVELLESFASGSRKNAGVMVRLRDPEVRRQIKGQLQTAERLTAINNVTSGVAHEVKNPLNAMLMHVELARIKLAKGDYDVNPQMEIIASEILRLDRVVKTFLDFTRPVEMKTTEIAVDSLMSEVAELARPQAQAVGVTMSAGLGAPGAVIAADGDLLKQAALNIVVNAIDAMPNGGELRFETSIEGEEAEIRISDSGPGIPPEKRDKIFQLYFTTKKRGSGIGLAMTFRIVQLHNGRIDFSSEPGKGTTFVLRFPLEGSSQ